MNAFVDGMILAYFLAGSIAGTLSGLFGIGGGIVLVPVFAWLFSVQNFSPQFIMVMAVATSLATIVFTSIFAARAHHRRGAVVWDVVWRLSPGLMLGAMAGSLVADRMPAELLKTVFALFLIIVTLQMWSKSSAPENAPNHHRHPFFLAGSLIGTASAILGIGGGTLTVPFLLNRQYSIRNAVAISSACGFSIASLGAITYIYLGWGNEQLPNHCLGYIYIPGFLGVIAASFLFAPIGARLAHQIPAQQLKRYFALVMCIVGIKMIW